MSPKRHVFSAFDAWILDILSSLAIGVIATALIAIAYEGLFPREIGADRGGAVVVVFLVLFVGLLICLRKTREKRDALAAEEGNLPEAGGPRARRPRG